MRTISALALVGDPEPRLVLARPPPVGRRLVVMALAGGAPAPVIGFPHKAAWSVASGSGAQVAATDNSSAGRDGGTGRPPRRDQP
jgi:hypothetical protein